MDIDNKRTGLKATLLEQFPESGEVPPGGIYPKMDGFIGIACPGCGQCSAMRVGDPKPTENPSWKTTGSKYDLTSFSLSPSDANRKLHIHFADTFRATISFSKVVAIKIGDIRLNTIVVSDNHDSIVMKTKNNRTITVSADVLRCMVDASYATKMEKQLNSLPMMQPGKLAAFSAMYPPPDEFYNWPATPLNEE